MRTEKVLVPDIGDIDEVEVVEVLVEAGAEIEVDDALITLESDKASMDVPAPFAGTVVDVAVSVGDKLAEGGLIVTMEVSGEAVAAAETEVQRPEAVEEAVPVSAAETAQPAPPPAPATSPPPAPASLPSIDEASFARAYASPAVRRFARELGVDLGRVQGTGRGGRIVRQDVQSFVKQALAGALAAGPSAGSLPGVEIPAMPEINFARFGEIERQPLSRIQKIAGPNLHRSWLHVPHVTQHDEADITDLEAFRQENKAKAKEEGFSLTVLPFIMKAAVAALEEFPAVNSSIDTATGELILKKYYHLGIAVDTPGGLIVPVIREVDCKGVFDLARELAEVSAAARDGKLKLDQLQGASFTITSLGGIGGTAFTPVVNAPEVGILGVSRSHMKPVWRESDDDCAFEPRLILPLSFSYDHRAVDGATAVRFTTFLAQELADIRRLAL